METTNRLHLITSACLVAVMTLLLSSCGNEYSSMPVPMLNKESVIVTGKTGKDTIYSYNDVNFVFHKVWLRQSDGTDYIDTQKDNRNEISDGQKQYAYAVEAIGRKDLHTSLILPYAGGAIEVK